MMLVARQPPTAGWIAHDLPAADLIPAHAHPRGHLVYAASGVFSLATDHGSWIAPRNRVAWTPARFEHAHRSHGRTDLRVVFLPDPAAARLPDRPAVLRMSGLAREAILALTGTRTYDPAARARLRLVLVGELDEVPEQPLHLPRPHDDRLRAVTDALESDPADPATLDELGKRAGTSARTLSRLFAHELGMSFYHWRTELRVHQALILLAQGHTSTHTAHHCGWSNPSSFISAFRRIVGITPSHYRTLQQPT